MTKKKPRKMSFAEMSERAEQAILPAGGKSWLDSHPLRDVILECFQNNVSLIGMSRVLKVEGYTITEMQLYRARARWRGKAYR